MGRKDYIAINMDAWNEAGLGPLPVEWTWDEYLEAFANDQTRTAGGSQYHTAVTLYPPAAL